MNKTFEKVLSVALSLAMIFTSVTMYNATVKAVADVTESVEQETVDVGSIDDWIQIGRTIYGNQVYISKTTTDKMGNDGLRGFYEAGKSVGWNISDNMKAVPVFGFVTSGSWASNVIIDGVRYVNDKDNTKAYVGRDCVYINQDVFKVPAGEERVFIITAEGSGTGTFALKVEGLKDPTDSDSIDVSDWTECPARGNNAKLVSGTYYMNTASYTANVNADIWGTVGKTSDTQYHGEVDNCKIDGGAFTFAIGGTVGDATAIWINGTRYLNASSVLHTRGNSIEIALSAFKEGINYFAIEGKNNTATFAIKYVPAQEEVAPNQTLDEVTDYVKVCDTAGTNNISADGTRYYVSESFRNANINYIDLFGLFTNHTEANYHPEGCTVTGPAYVSSYPKVAGTIQSVWIDGVKYETDTENCYITGDQVHLSQNLFKLSDNQNEKIFAITVRAKNTDLTYGIKVEKVDTCKMKFDDKTLLAARGDKYALPKSATYGATYGYLKDGSMYKPAAIINDVNEDMNFTSVKTLSVEMLNGAGIRYQGESGLRFQSKITCNNEAALNSAAITEGTLITTEDLYNKETSGEFEIGKYEAAMINVENSGWYNKEVGTYCGSICKIAKENYPREFRARAYVTVKYVDGTSETIYSSMENREARSIQYVAKAIVNAGFPNIENEADQNRIKEFAGIAE